VTLTVRCGQLRQGTSHFPQSLRIDEVEGTAIQVTCSLLAENGLATCSNTTLNKVHEFFDHTGLALKRLLLTLRRHLRHGQEHLQCSIAHSQEQMVTNRRPNFTVILKIFEGVLITYARSVFAVHYR
jgi:hypothetical protein